MASSPLRRAMTNAAVMTVTLGVCLGFTEVVVRLLHKPVPTVLTKRLIPEPPGPRDMG